MKIVENRRDKEFNVRCNNPCCFALIEISQKELNWVNKDDICYGFTCPACGTNNHISSDELWG